MKTHPEDGIPIAIDAPGAVSQTPGAPAETLADLLARIERNSTQNKMVLSVAARFLEYMNLTAEKTPIEALITEKKSFIDYLKSGKYKASSVKTYRNYINILIRTAEGMGWARPKMVIPPVWQSLLDGTARSSIKPIVLYAIRIGRTPSTLSEDDLSAWKQERVKAGYSLQDAQGDCSRLRTGIVKAGLSGEFPLIKPRDKRYGIPVAQMHPELRQEVEELLEWKTSDFQLDRPLGARIRPISAKRLSDLLGQLTGYVQNVANKPGVTSIASLVTRDHVARFTTWAKNTRKVKGQSLSTGLGMVFAALRHNPRYASLDLSWFESIIDQLPVESQSTIDQRKAKKYIPYSEAEQIPVTIRAQRLKMKTRSPHKAAIYARNELLMLWLCILPWRQRNIRECKVIGGDSNLYKAKIAPFSTATKPTWVEEQEKKNGGGSFWQIRFSADETKTKNEIEAFLPSELVPLLEEYLSVHRPNLVPESGDSGMLFVNHKGLPMNVGQMRNLVSKLASTYAGVPVTPHLYRDIVAFEWLSEHPEDYLTLSKLLWHRNLKTTLSIYGHRFDESTGIARMDDWRSSRAKSSKS